MSEVGVYYTIKMSWDVITLKLVGRYMLSPDAQILFLSIAFYLHKIAYVRGCLYCVWVVSGWCVGVSGDVPIPNPLAKCYIRSLYSDITFSFNPL